MDLPLYVGETRHYRRILGISWEFGLKLRRAGVLVPDARLDDGQVRRVLYLLTPEKLRQTQADIARYRSLSKPPPAYA